MKRSKKFLTLLLAVCMVMAMMPSMAFAAGTDKTDDIVILHTNDIHSEVNGYAKLAAYKSEMEKAANYVALVDAGDALQGDAIATLSKGDYLVQIMNKVGYDIAVPGNHEFDFGMEQFLKNVKNSDAKYLSANFMDLRTKKTVFDAYEIKTYGDKKVAFVGMSTPETTFKSTPTYFQDANGEYIYGFCPGNDGKDLYDAVQKAIDAAKAEGADYIIGVGHLGIDEESSPWTSREVIANTTGFDAVIDGHSHSVIENEKVKAKDGKEVVLASTGTKFESIGNLTIAADGTITSTLVKDYTLVDDTVDEFIKGIQNKLSSLLNKVVAKSDVDLTINNPDETRAIRSKETNLGDLVADAYRTMGGTDVAIVNGGGIRETIKAGDITYDDIIKVHPFNNTLCTVEATGQEIIDALEVGAKVCPGESGGFMQVSGMTYEIDTTIPSTVVINDKGEFVKVEGERRVKNVKVNGTDIDLTKTYTLAAHNFMLKDGGDNITMFKDNKIIKDEVMLDNEVLINYIKDTLGGVVGKEYAKPQGRIKILKNYSQDEYDQAIANTEKEIVKQCKAAAARTTKITSAKAVSKKMQTKVTKNSKADGYYYRIYNAKGKKVASIYTAKTTYKSSKKLVKGTYTVKVQTYNKIAGERVFGKLTTKKVVVK